jgi:hypothetical protein
MKKGVRIGERKIRKEAKEVTFCKSLRIWVLKATTGNIKIKRDFPIYRFHFWPDEHWRHRNRLHQHMFRKKMRLSYNLPVDRQGRLLITGEF